MRFDQSSIGRAVACLRPAAVALASIAAAKVFDLEHADEPDAIALEIMREGQGS
ncbi:MAG: hypothetical protein AAGC60_03745 [Acidobacteriota bacterium]